MKDIRQKLLATFQIEHRDHVEQIRSLLAMISKTTPQPAGPAFDEAFRRAHSLKGAARAVDLRGVEGLAHRLETFFSRVRRGELPLDQHAAAIVQQVLDASEDCVTNLAENGPAPAFAPALQAIESLLGIAPEETPTPEPPQLPIPAFQPIQMLRITARSFDGLLRSAGGLLAESQRQSQAVGRLSAMAEQLAGAESQVRLVSRSLSASRRNTPELQRVRSFVEDMEAQVRSLSAQAREALRLQERSSWTMHHLGSQLQSDIWQARMAPAEDLLEGYRKLVRDLARDESKQVEFNAYSTGVQADRRVLEALKDPVMHLLRNAVSHGLETPAERTSKNKSPAGALSLRIATQGSRLTIAIEDDGRGVDLARVAEVAVQQGLLPSAEAAGASPQHLSRFLFRAGFSTSPKVTNLSGRGMGLSVVYESVRRLQGEVELAPSSSGGGASIHISVPLSVSAHRLLLMSCGPQYCAVPVHAVERLHRIKPAAIRYLEGKPVILLDGQPVPLFSLHEFLGLPHLPSLGPDPVLPVMILRLAGTRAAVVVDRFLSEIETLVQDWGPLASAYGKVSGGIVLKDGAVAFVLNLMELLDVSTHRQWQPLPIPAPAAHSPRVPTILVVDDSLTTRTLEKSILEAHGYKVRIAVDGLEALDLLRIEPVDLVISDVEMPRLDGFGLLEAMKKELRLARLPVIVVTSLDSPEKRKRGLALGADAYIVKRKFDQGELLAAIRQML